MVVLWPAETVVLPLMVMFGLTELSTVMVRVLLTAVDVVTQLALLVMTALTWLPSVSSFVVYIDPPVAK